ncbi:MAG TPA: hypothetical protein VNN62_00480 [Methylomirabilota bacterium]|jgi:hypothetical protein|nr:hypothetical protein [Methylomirabilota bacterium]
MKLQSTGGALLLAASLISFPSISFTEEEGSMSGQEAHGGQAHHAKDSMKKQTGAAEHPQAGSSAAPQAATAQDGHGKRAAQQEQADEGSH